MFIARVVLKSSDAGGQGKIGGKPVSAGHSSQRRRGKGEASWVIGCRGGRVGDKWEEEGGDLKG